VNNLGYRRVEESSATRYEGVLLDFDLAYVEKGDAASSGHRTGTTPFLSLDLLANPTTRHTVAHDLESLIYALIWITTNYEEGGKQVKQNPLRDWYTGSADQMRRLKLGFVEDRKLLLQPHYSALGPGLQNLCELVDRAYISKRTEGLANIDIASESMRDALESWR
jgi:hypothetical protein